MEYVLQTNGKSLPMLFLFIKYSLAIFGYLFYQLKFKAILLFIIKLLWDINWNVLKFQFEKKILDFIMSRVCCHEEWNGIFFLLYF